LIDKVLIEFEGESLMNDRDESIDKFATILEKFGLDIITKIGQTNFKINTLTDKIDELSKATLDVKTTTDQCY
jgi:hypothetical protein